MTDRPHMLTEDFEAVARVAAREVEGLRLEFIDGVIRSKAVPDGDHDRRDRVEKPLAYARTGIPVYLLIDREACDVTVFSEPDGRRYANTRTVEFGNDVELPDPVNVTLRTEVLKDWVR